MTNKEKFIEKANEKYNSKYDYSLLDYKELRTSTKESTELFIEDVLNGKILK